MKTVLYVLAETVRRVAILIQPIMPDSGASLLDQLKVPADTRAFVHLSAAHALTGGTAIDKPVPVFPRIVVEDAAAKG